MNKRILAFVLIFAMAISLLPMDSTSRVYADSSGSVENGSTPSVTESVYTSEPTIPTLSPTPSVAPTVSPDQSTIEGVVSLYLGTQNTTAYSMMISKLKLREADKALKDLDINLGVQGGIGVDPIQYKGEDIFVPQNGHLAILDSNKGLLAKVRIPIGQTGTYSISVGGAGYKEHKFSIACETGKTNVFNTEENPLVLIPGDIASSNNNLATHADGVIDTHDYDRWRALYKKVLAKTNSEEELVLGDFTRDGKVNNIDYSLWYECYRNENIGISKAELDVSLLEIGFSYGDDANSVTSNIMLPLVGANGSTITWTSDNVAIVSNDGTVTQLAEESAMVKLTASIVNSNITRSKEFTLKVIKQFINQELKDRSLDDLMELNYGEMPELSYNSNNKIDFIDGCYTDMVIESPREAIHSLHSVQSIFGIQSPEEEFVWSNTNRDEDIVAYKLQQMHQGVPVFGSEMVVATDRDGKALSLSGDYISGLNLSMTPRISEQDAINAAVQQAGGTTTAQSKGLVVEFLHTDTPVLAWRINVTGMNASNQYVNSDTFINAISGEYVHSISLSYAAKAYSASGTDVLGKTRNFTVYGLEGWERLNLFDPNFKLYDPNRKIKTYNAADGKFWTDMPGTLITSYFDNSWGDEAAVSAHANLSETYDYYKNVLGRDSIDGKGMEIVSSVHVGTWLWGLVTYENAYWSGSKLQIAFGDGEDTFKPLSAALDVVAHEYTHGVVQYTAGLIYENESGALNESYADILGNLVENKSDNEWLIGEDAMKNPGSTRALRNMSNPNEFNQPESLNGTFYVSPCTHSTHTGNCDNGGVHQNSGIVNHAAYLMWHKGILDKQKLAKLWYKSLLKLTSSSDYHDCRKAVISAAKNMGMSEAEIQIIKSSFDEVNIKSMTPQTVSGLVYKADTDRIMVNDPVLEGVTVTVNKEGSSTVVAQVKTDASGKYKVDNLLPAKYKFTFGKADYTPYIETIIISDEDVYKDIWMDTLYRNNLSGKITIADDDTNYTNNLPLEGATVSIRKINGSAPLAKTAITGANGNYTISDLPSGLFEVTISKQGYIQATQTIVIKENQVNYYNAIVEAIPNELSGDGTASGRIVDVLTGNGVFGLTLKIRSGLNNTSEGIVFESLKTGTNGTYTTRELPAGYYCIEIIDERSLPGGDGKYLTSFVNIKVLGGRDISDQNGIVTTSMYTDQLRIVLSWGSTPSDLDSHLFGPTSSGGKFHTWYNGKTYIENGIKMADLDLDDVSSWGPETTTIYKPVTGKYRFYVHDYTNRGSLTSTGMGNSGANIQVFIGSSTVPLYVFNVPQEAGTMWAVFEYDSITQQITPVNKVYFGEPNDMIP